MQYSLHSRLFLNILMCFFLLLLLDVLFLGRWIRWRIEKEITIKQAD